MSKTVVIHQPDFMPYLGFFQRFLYSDLYIALDHAQFVNGTSRAWTHRDKIMTPKGPRWLSISVQKSARQTPINQILLADDHPWREEHLRLFYENYRTAPYYGEVMPNLESLYCEPCKELFTFNLQSIKMLMRLLDVTRPITLSSELGPVGQKNEMLVGLLQKVNATHYLSGVGAKDYYESAPFSAAGIKVVWQDFEHPVYPQLHCEFEPYLSSIDLLFNCGIDAARRILRGNKQ